MREDKVILAYTTGLVWQGIPKLLNDTPLEVLAIPTVQKDLGLWQHIWLAPKYILSYVEVLFENLPLYINWPWVSNKFQDYLRK